MGQCNGDTPICATCRKPMRLLDLRRKADELGYSIPDDGSRYVIHCCGYELMIEDDQLYAAAIQSLLKYHELGTE